VVAIKAHGVCVSLIWQVNSLRGWGVVKRASGSGLQADAMVANMQAHVAVVRDEPSVPGEAGFTRYFFCITLKSSVE